MNFLVLLVGLAITIKSADTLIGSTSRIAYRYNVSTFVVGITIVALGTSAPELVVGIMSAIEKTNQLALGTIIGSSYANMALIIGISTIIFPLAVNDSVVKREIPLLIFIQCVLAFMVLFDSKLTRFEGIILLIGFVGFIAYIIIDSQKSTDISIDSESDLNACVDESLDASADGSMSEEKSEEPSIKKLWIFSALSLIGLYIGGKLSVDSSILIAEHFGISETIIGLTIVAVGTSLPELVTSVVAVRKKEPDMVLGNCVGSNIINILLVLGISCAISPFAVQENMTVDALFIIFLNMLVFMVALFAKKIHRLPGSILVMSYIGYIGFKVMMVFS